MYFCLWNQLAAVTEAIFTKQGIPSVLERDTGPRGEQQKDAGGCTGFWASSPHDSLLEAVDAPCLSSTENSSSCCWFEWLPCPEKRKQIREQSAAVPAVQTFLWGVQWDREWGLVVVLPWSHWAGRASASWDCLTVTYRPTDTNWEFINEVAHLRQICCLSTSDQFTSPLSPVVPTWQKVGHGWAVQGRDRASLGCRVCKGQLSAPWCCVTVTLSHCRVGQSVGEKEPCFILSMSCVQIVALGDGTERWAVHHSSSVSLVLGLRHLI